MEKTIVRRVEPEFAVAHRLLSELSWPPGPLPGEGARCFMGDGLHELIGLYEPVGQEPGEELPVEYASLDDARVRLDEALALLLTGAETLEESLRLVRVREAVAAAWADLQRVGERP